VTRREKPGAAVVEFIPGEEDDLPALPDLPDEAELLNEDDLGEEPSRSDRGRRKRGTASETSISPARRTTVKPDRKILVNACDQEEIRVAVVKDGKILDFQMNVESDTSLVNDIYRGRIVNIEHSIGAAFVDFGRGRNGFLHTSDVLPSYAEKGLSLSKLLATDVDPEDWDSGSSPPSVAEEMDHDDHDEDEDEGDDDSSGSEGDKGSTTKDKKPEGRGRRGPAKGKGRGDKGKQKHFRARPRRPIDELFKVGQKVVVQITKDAIGDKGPTLTTYLSIPGRYLVLMPSISHCGVSRKIEDSKERKRLKRILDSLNVPEGMGIIARTATMGHTKAEIKRDLDYLLSAWNQLASRLDKGHGPTALYQESDVAIRTVRDLFGPETEAVIVDEPETYKSIRDFAELLMPEHADRIVEHDGSRPLFHAEGVEQDFEKIFSRRIELPSGGSIVFDQAEALVAIDVNSGKTRTASHDFEEIALKTNMEAVPEIARQIRLRDLGGIIVVDFIDMMKNSNRKGVEQTFRGRFSDDRARSKVGRISQFGLLEMTRQRLGPGMSKKLFRPCVACRGAGRQRTESSRSAAILRRLGSALTLKGFTTVELKAHPETIEYLKKVRTKELEALEESSGRKLELKSVPDQLEDSVLRYLRTDGREVRPGGRRKR
jgi:ribonuclease E